MGSKVSKPNECLDSRSLQIPPAGHIRKRLSRSLSTKSPRSKVSKNTLKARAVIKGAAEHPSLPGLRGHGSAQKSLACHTEESPDHDVYLDKQTEHSFDLITAEPTVPSQGDTVCQPSITHPLQNTSTLSLPSPTVSSPDASTNQSRRATMSAPPCLPTDSGHQSLSSSSWIIAEGLFSQVDPLTSSTITSATDHSILSHHSHFNWPEENKKIIPVSPANSPSRMIAHSPLPKSVGHSTPNIHPGTPVPHSMPNTTRAAPHEAVPTSNAILHELISSPTNAYAILHHAFEDIAHNNYDYQARVFSAARTWSESTGSVPAKVWVARCQIEGWGVLSNPATGFHQLKSLAEHGHWEAYYPLAMCYLRGVHTHSHQHSIQTNAVQFADRKEAIKWLKEAAKLDLSTLGRDAIGAVSWSQYRIGTVLFEDNSASDGIKTALIWFLKSANHGNKFAQYLVGFYYEQGVGMEQDHEKAKHYYTQSAEQGSADAKTALGIRLVEEGNFNDGLRWLKEAEQQENTRAMLKLGIMHEQGHGVDQDNEQAFYYYRTAAEHHDTSAQYLLGLHYRLGTLDLQKSLRDARYYLHSSAKAGFAPAQRLLGLMYKEGLISLGDSSEAKQKEQAMALEWLQQAANQGDACALGLVGEFYETGQGDIVVNYETALEYYRMGAQIKGPFQGMAHLAQALLLHRMGRFSEAYNYFTCAVQFPDMASCESSHVQTAKLMMARYRLTGWCEDVKDPASGFDLLLELLQENKRDGHVSYWLAACYEEGIPDRCEVNLEKAFQLYLAAANEGDVDAEHQVALMLAHGEGTYQDQALAFRWYEKAAANDHKTALYSVGLYYANGLAGVQKDLKKAGEYFEKSAQLGSPIAMKAFADWCRMSAKSSRRTQEQQEQLNQNAVHWYMQAASHDDVSAMRELGMVFDKGLIGVPQNHETALQYLRQATSKNDAHATLLLGRYYQDGIVVETCLDHAVGLYLKAARLGAPVAPFAAAEAYRFLYRYEESYAQYKIAADDPRLANTRIHQDAKLMLARFILCKVPFPEDENPATFIIQNTQNMTIQDAFRALYDLATKDNFEPSFYWLADCYQQGHGTSSNTLEALKWFEKAINETQDVEAMIKLAVLYEEGQGVAPNEALAFKYYQLSAANGHREGQHKLGMAYWRGLFNTTINLGEAVVWFTQAAAQKYAESRWALGVMALENGDDDVAMEWWRKSIDLGHNRSMRDLARLLLKTTHPASDQRSETGRALEHLAREALHSGDAEVLVLLGHLHQSESVKVSNLEDISKDEDIEEEEDEEERSEKWRQRQKESQDLATRCFAQAALMGHVQAMYLTAESWHMQQQYAAALEYYERAVNEGHLLSRVMRARYRLSGLGGIEQDPERGYKELLTCALEEECVATYILLGQCHEHGLGTAQDDRQALEWYVRSARETEDAEAMFRIGQMHAQDRVPTQSEAGSHDFDALQWFRLASDKADHARASYHLGLYFIRGITSNTGETLLVPSQADAKHLFERAAALGDGDAMFELGQMLLLNGSETTPPRDATSDKGSDDGNKTASDGLTWLLQAAELGSRDAQRELGKLYHSGHEWVMVLQDFEQAYDYFCRAAQQGDKTATLFLGIYHEHGIHVPPSTVLAREWYDVAVRLGQRQDQGGWWLAELAMAHLLHQDLDSRAEAYFYFEAAHRHAPEHQKNAAATMLARYRLHGWGGVPVQVASAAATLIDLAAAGEVKVYLEVAQCYELGIGVAKDLLHAFKWYGCIVAHYAARKTDIMDEEDQEDYAEALCKLAEFYRHGKAAVPPDAARSDHLYHLAAEQGSKEAQEYLEEHS